MARKDDIPDAGYLALRLAYYDAVARAFGFEVYDGSRPIEENLQQLLRFTRQELAKPHVHYVHSNNEDVGGADKVLVRMAQHMGARDSGGYRTSVSLRLPTSAAALHEAAGTPVLLRRFTRPQMSAGAGSLVRLTWSAPQTYFYFKRLFRVHGPDLVHVNDVYDFLPALAARSAGIPVVHHLRMFQGRLVVRRLMARLVAQAAASVAVSDAVRRHYFPQSPPGHRAEMIHDLGDASLLLTQGDVQVAGPRPDGMPPDGRLVTMVGRVEEWKGQAVFLDAVALLSPMVRRLGTFVLVGGPVPHKESYFEAVGRRARELGVHVLGVRDDVPAVLRASDISVHASTQPDPFPGVVVESLLAGTAVIASCAGGVPEMIDSGEVGVLVRPGDAAELAAALSSLLEAPTSPRGRYARAARARAVVLVDAVHIDAQMRDLYDSILAPTREALG